MTLEEKYQLLHNRFSNATCPDYKIRMLKSHFRDKIDSDRRFDRISNVMSLLKILERRDLIRPGNIYHLRHIANVLEREDILGLINDYYVQPIQQNVAPNVDRVLPRVDPDRDRRIYDVICMEIGQKWKEFARKLKIGEGYIDQLEIRYLRSVPDIVREIIKYHRETCDPNYWQNELCNALMDARRRDLSRKVQDIFAITNQHT